MVVTVAISQGGEEFRKEKHEAKQRTKAKAMAKQRKAHTGRPLPACVALDLHESCVPLCPGPARSPTAASCSGSLGPRRVAGASAALACMSMSMGQAYTIRQAMMAEAKQQKAIKQNRMVSSRRDTNHLMGFRDGSCGAGCNADEF